MTGIGGGIFIVPLLTLVYSLSPAHAVGTSLAAIFFTAVAATVSYSRQKRVNYKTGFLLALATAPGAIIGAYLTTVISARILGISFGVFLILMALRIMKETAILEKRSLGKEAVLHSLASSEVNSSADKRRWLLGVVLGFFGGIASGLLGVGGGIVIVPIMMFALGISITNAVATSMFTMIFTSISGVGQHYVLGNINFEYALFLGAGSILGAQIGAYVCKNVSGRTLQVIFGLMLIVISVQMILKFIQ